MKYLYLKIQSGPHHEAYNQWARVPLTDDIVTNLRAIQEIVVEQTTALLGKAIHSPSMDVMCGEIAGVELLPDVYVEHDDEVVHLDGLHTRLIFSKSETRPTNIIVLDDPFGIIKPENDTAPDEEDERFDTTSFCVDPSFIHIVGYEGDYGRHETTEFTLAELGDPSKTIILTVMADASETTEGDFNLSATDAYLIRKTAKND